MPFRIVRQGMVQIAETDLFIPISSITKPFVEALADIVICTNVYRAYPLDNVNVPIEEQGIVLRYGRLIHEKFDNEEPQKSLDPPPPECPQTGDAPADVSIAQQLIESYSPTPVDSPSPLVDEFGDDIPF